MHLLQRFMGRYASVCNAEEAILMTNVVFFYSPALGNFWLVLRAILPRSLLFIE